MDSISNKDGSVAQKLSATENITKTKGPQLFVLERR
jgi:hypothetical protein